MITDPFWTGLKRELTKQSVTEHPLYLDLVNGTLKRSTIGDGIGSGFDHVHH